ncbi:MAG: SDR family NAD(P)-dependent oxidoreductase [Deltaproteobacteria bacterium]|nr:SDR family NAD(P)-dependent oxidoreductase [Deltaproteobacteria bacterium]
MSLAGKVALVTGASRGIGRAVADALLGEGARVGLIARDPERLAGAERALREAHPGGELASRAGDVGDAAAVERIVTELEEHLGPVDLLVNNAGVVHRSPVAGHSLEAWDAVLETNLRGAFLYMRAVLPGMISRGAGRIVNVSSISGTLGTAGLSAYCASKWGLIGLTKSAAEEVREHGILVAAVCPGSVDTDMLKQGVPGLQPDMSPAEVARTILFLSKDAPLAMTGSAVEIFG